jgi:hypothetical protein
VTSLLLDGDPEGGAEAIRGEVVRADLAQRDVTEEDLVKAVRTEEAVDDLESWLLANSEKRISERQEHGHSLPKLVEQEMNTLPGWLADRLLRGAIDDAERFSFTQPEDYERLIGLLQIQAEWFGEDQNREERKTLWDQALKYSLYRAAVEIDGSTFVSREWSQSETKVHNAAVFKALEDAEGDNVDDVTVTVEELFMPDTDPLNDLEEFVYRW